MHFDSQICYNSIIQKPKTNNEIQARELRVIGRDGNNLGILSISEALRLAREAGVDLIEISPTASPPVAKIMDRGKFFYEQEKRERQAAKKRKEVEIKSVRIGIGTSLHDLTMKAQQSDEFLDEGHKIKVDLALRGREKYLDQKFLKDRIDRFINLISRPIIAEPAKKGPRGLSVIVQLNK